jgi:hypothetical protein
MSTSFATRFAKPSYRKVSHRWLQGYLNEFTWRYNMRYQRNPSMFAELVEKACAK